MIKKGSFYYPETENEAKRKRYGQWSGNPRGYPYDNKCCAIEVSDRKGWLRYQCSRKAVTGPGNLYCKQHAKKHGLI